MIVHTTLELQLKGCSRVPRLTLWVGGEGCSCWFVSAPTHCEQVKLHLHEVTASAS